MTRAKTKWTSVLAVLLALGMLAGCGGDPGEAGVSPARAESDAGDNSNGEPTSSQGITLRYHVSEVNPQGGEIADLVALVREKTGIQIELVVVPGTDAAAGEIDRLLVALQAGDELDILYGTTAKLKAYYSAGVLLPMDELAGRYDMEGVYGGNLPIMDDGGVYGLPAFNDIWITIYNKQIFDEAGVAYPPLEGFTWDRYIETARRLTDRSKDIWGSYMLDYDCYNYMLAVQKGAQPYRDGGAGFDDPRYRESLEFFYSLGNDEQIQPDAALQASGAYSWDRFVADNNMGMWVVGGWAASMLPNREDYPRDWRAGLAPMPYPEGENPSTLAITGCYAIPATCRNPEAALEAIRCMAENQYTLGYGRIPARVDLGEEEIMAYIEEKLIPAYRFDGITAEELRACWFDAGRSLLPEKIVGPADHQINQIWVEEGQLYGQGYKSAEEAVASIQERANRAIAGEAAAHF